MSDLDFKTIGIKIKERRQYLGITQEAIANYLDVNPSHISNIERGRANPSLTILVKIANYLQCSVDCFINEEYTYLNNQSETINDKIMGKVRYCSDEKKQKILKMIDII